MALYEAYIDDDAFYLISELVHGETLAALIATDELSDEELLQVGLALTQALAHAHARGVIHRDVKPQNVLIPHDRDVRAAPAKLTDFGGASLTGEDALTRTGETLGTLAYMAPEQSEGREIGESADLYSLALVLYEGLTGINPVRGPTPAATARRIGRPLPPLTTRRPDLPRALVSALDSALTVDPDCRGTLAELCVALEQSLEQGLTRRRGLFGARIARARSRPYVTDWPSAADAPEAHGPLPAAAEQRTVLDNRALPPRRSVLSRRSDPLDRLARGDDGVAPQDSLHAPSDATHASRRRLQMPRAVWMGCVLAAAAWLVAEAPPGGRAAAAGGHRAPAAAGPATGDRLVRRPAWRRCSASWASRGRTRRWPARRPRGRGGRRWAPSATGG